MDDLPRDITEILKESAHRMNKCVVVITRSAEFTKFCQTKGIKGKNLLTFTGCQASLPYSVNTDIWSGIMKISSQWLSEKV